MSGVGRVNIRPPDGWASKSDEEKTAWVRGLIAEVLAGEDDTEPQDGP